MVCVSMWTKSLQLCLTLCDCNPPGSSVCGILLARILEWVAMPSSRGSSWPRDRTCISCLLHWQAGSLPLAPPRKFPPPQINTWCLKSLISMIYLLTLEDASICNPEYWIICNYSEELNSSTLWSDLFYKVRNTRIIEKNISELSRLNIPDLVC